MLAIYIARFMIIPFLFTHKMEFKLFYVPILLISLDSLIQNCVFWLVKQMCHFVNEENVTRITSFGFQIILLAFLFITYKKNLFKNFRFGLKLVAKPVYILILTSIFIIDGVISCITYETNRLDLQRIIITYFMIILMIIVLIILLSFLINNMSKKCFEYTSRLMKEQVQNQLSHYEILDDMKKEYRSFRHDYKNHMHCIRALINSNKTDEAISYIDKLSDTHIIKTELFETGNHILDSILNNKANAAAKHATTIKVNGIFTDDFEVVDLCIIFSNLLDNSIEACSLIDGEKVITINIRNQQGYQFISITNPVGKAVKANLTTTKKDKEYHGSG